MENIDKELKACRDEINEIDDKLVALFIKRMEIAGKIGSLKKEAGLPVLNVKREDEVRERLLSKTPGEYKESLGSLYNAIFKISKKYQGEDNEV